MIIGFFISIFTAIVTAFVGLLPEYDFPSEWADAVEMVWGLANTVNYLFPLDTLVQVLTIILFLHTSVFVWHLTVKIYFMLRGTR